MPEESGNATNTGEKYQTTILYVDTVERPIGLEVYIINYIMNSEPYLIFLYLFIYLFLILYPHYLVCFLIIFNNIC